MVKEIIITKDGSHSLFVPDLNETYHSRNGAISESKHVFIKNALLMHPENNIKILEVGFGTGLNTWLTLENIGNKKIHYTTLEPFPIKKEIYTKLNFNKFIHSNYKLFIKTHTSKWNKNINLCNNFVLHKLNHPIQNYCPKKKFDIIYFDAFAPNKQSEMWTQEILEKCFKIINENGFLVTYCAKGKIKRLLQSIGFKLEVLKGPPGKREMIRARKTISQK